MNDLWRASQQAEDGEYAQAAATAALVVVDNVPGGRAIRGTRAAVRSGLSALGLAPSLERATSRLIRDAGRGDAWGVETIRDGGAMVHRFVPGSDGTSSVIYTYILDESGRVVANLQRAWDGAGNLNHFDVKR